MPCNDETFVKAYANNMVPNSKRQMPVYSQIGRGPKGNDAALVLDQEDPSNPKFISRIYNYTTDELTDIFELPLIFLVPKIHYQTWRGVREISGVNWWGYYIKFSCDISFDGGDPIVFWVFDTPFAITDPFNGETIPPDYIIDSDEEV